MRAKRSEARVCLDMLHELVDTDGVLEARRKFDSEGFAARAFAIPGMVSFIL